VTNDMIAVRIGRHAHRSRRGSVLFHHGVRTKKAAGAIGHNSIDLNLPTHSGLGWPRAEGASRGPARVQRTFQMLNAGLAGFGLAYVPENVAQPHVAKGRLKRVLEDWCPPNWGCHLYYPQPTAVHARIQLARRREGRRFVGSDRFGEGFRMPALVANRARSEGGPPKASQEGTREPPFEPGTRRAIRTTNAGYAFQLPLAAGRVAGSPKLCSMESSFHSPLVTRAAESLDASCVLVGLQPTDLFRGESRDPFLPWAPALAGVTTFLMRTLVRRRLGIFCLCLNTSAPILRRRNFP
jgi:hypothetical protein